jgi:hypothetical protein
MELLGIIYGLGLELDDADEAESVEGVASDLEDKAPIRSAFGGVKNIFRLKIYIFNTQNTQKDTCTKRKVTGFNTNDQNEKPRNPLTNHFYQYPGIPNIFLNEKKRK